MQLDSTSLTKYKLTEKEQISGSVLTTLNLAVLQNILADTAESRLNLEFDPLNPVKFAQDEAFLQGQIKILKYIIQMHEEFQESYLRIQQQDNEN